MDLLPPAIPSLDDTEALESSDRVVVESVVGTRIRPPSPQARCDEHGQAGRRYFHYVTTPPSGMSMRCSPPTSRCMKKSGQAQVNR
jgi:hypothetical protein